VRYFRQKFTQLVIVLFAVTVLTFWSVRLLPGNPAIFRLGPGATAEQIAAEEARLGLDDPVPIQYVKWMGNVITGDFGQSTNSNVLVSELIKQRLPPTLWLMFWSLTLALAIAVPLGVVTAYRNGSGFDRSANVVSFGLLSVPNFIMGLVLVFFLSVKLGWFPTISRHYAPWTNPWEHFRSYFLPSLTLALGLLATFMRLVRADMTATLQNDFITMARAKGMGTNRILFRHALRPSSFSLITAAGLNVGALIGGTLLVEPIFQLNGMGTLVAGAVFSRDYPVIQASVIVFAVGYVLINFAVDLTYAVLDPRIRHARALA
jgi:peptide/nickel transport system permease protein